MDQLPDALGRLNELRSENPGDTGLQLAEALYNIYNFPLDVIAEALKKKGYVVHLELTSEPGRYLHVSNVNADRLKVVYASPENMPRVFLPDRGTMVRHFWYCSICRSVGWFAFENCVSVDVINDRVVKAHNYRSGCKDIPYLILGSLSEAPTWAREGFEKLKK